MRRDERKEGWSGEGLAPESPQYPHQPSWGSMGQSPGAGRHQKRSSFFMGQGTQGLSHSTLEAVIGPGQGTTHAVTR